MQKLSPIGRNFSKAFAEPNAGLGKRLLILCLATCIACGSALLSAQIDIDFQQLREHMRDRYSQERVEVLRQWQIMLSESVDRPAEEKLAIVNDFFHRNVRYKLDSELYGEEDYWATPLETLGQGLGDCEDWAIAKYASLRQLGISDEQLRLIYVRARIGGSRSTISRAHMVLGYYPTPDSEPIILDSLVSSVLPASQRTDLSPTFSFNAEGLWIGHGPDRASGTPTARMSRWRDVLDRMHEEGIPLQ